MAKLKLIIFCKKFYVYEKKFKKIKKFSTFLNIHSRKLSFVCIKVQTESLIILKLILIGFMGIGLNFTVYIILSQ